MGVDFPRDYPHSFSTIPRFKVLSRALISIGSIYAGVLRLGIDKNKIQQAQREATFEAVENWAEKQKRKT